LGADAVAPLKRLYQLKRVAYAKVDEGANQNGTEFRIKFTKIMNCPAAFTRAFCGLVDVDDRSAVNRIPFFIIGMFSCSPCGLSRRLKFYRH